MPANVTSMAFNERNGLPWHKTGTAVDGLMTAEEALEKAGLNFTVEKVPTYFNYNGNTAQLRRKAVVRTDTGVLLGEVGPDYAILQNREAFAFFDSLVDKGEAVYETAGVINFGRKVWLLAKMPDHIDLPGGDTVETHVLLSNAHDGSQAVHALITPIRVVCENTLMAAIDGSQNVVRIEHRGDVESKLREAHKILGISSKLTKELDVIFGRMADKRFDRKWLEEFALRTVDPDWNGSDDISVQAQNLAAEIMNKAFLGIGQDLPAAERTAWGAYNAVAEVVDYSGKGTQWILYGHGKTLKQRAFDLCYNYINEGPVLVPVEVGL